MATVRMMIKSTDRPSEEQLQRIREGAGRPIAFDGESPEMTEEMLAKFRRVSPKKEAVES